MFTKRPRLPGQNSPGRVLPGQNPERVRFTDPAVPLRACCCPARPAIKVVLPPRLGRDHPVDLWLCRHHYRSSAAALLAAGASAENIAFAGDPEPGEDITVPV